MLKSMYGFSLTISFGETWYRWISPGYATPARIATPTSTATLHRRSRQLRRRIVTRHRTATRPARTTRAFRTGSWAWTSEGAETRKGYRRADFTDASAATSRRIQNTRTRPCRCGISRPAARFGALRRFRLERGPQVPSPPALFRMFRVRARRHEGQER